MDAYTKLPLVKSLVIIRSWKLKGSVVFGGFSFSCLGINPARLRAESRFLFVFARFIKNRIILCVRRIRLAA